MKNIVFLRMMGLVLVLTVIFSCIGIHCMNVTNYENVSTDEEPALCYAEKDVKDYIAIVGSVVPMVCVMLRYSRGY